MQFFFLENVCLSTKFNLRLKKNQKDFWGNFKFTWKNFLCRHQKNASHATSIYGKCDDNRFFPKRKHSFFITNTDATDTNADLSC